MIMTPACFVFIWGFIEICNIPAVSVVSLYRSIALSLYRSSVCVQHP